jgi:hypothetical protein
MFGATCTIFRTGAVPRAPGARRGPQGAENRPKPGAGFIMLSSRRSARQSEWDLDMKPENSSCRSRRPAHASRASRRWDPGPVPGRENSRWRVLPLLASAQHQLLTLAGSPNPHNTPKLSQTPPKTTPRPTRSFGRGWGGFWCDFGWFFVCLGGLGTRGSVLSPGFAQRPYGGIPLSPSGQARGLHPAATLRPPALTSPGPGFTAAVRRYTVTGMGRPLAGPLSGLSCTSPQA